MNKKLEEYLPVIFWALVISLTKIIFGFETAVLLACTLVLSKLK